MDIRDALDACLDTQHGLVEPDGHFVRQNGLINRLMAVRMAVGPTPRQLRTTDWLELPVIQMSSSECRCGDAWRQAAGDPTPGREVSEER